MLFTTSNEFTQYEDTYIGAFETFLMRYHRKDIRRILQSVYESGNHSSSLPTSESTTELQSNCTILIDAQMLIHYDPNLSQLLFQFPEKMLELCNKSLSKCIKSASTAHAFNFLIGGSDSSYRVHVENLPPVPCFRIPMISRIRSSDVRRLIQVSGTVVRTGAIRMQQVLCEYKCLNSRCQYTFLVKSDPEQENRLQVPKACPSERKNKCRSTQFQPIEGSQVVSDHQVIKIQEQASKLSIGSIPRSISVILEDDLVDRVKAGDHIVVTGILMRSWKPCVKDVRCDLENFIQANSVRVTNSTSIGAIVTEEHRKEFESFWLRHSTNPIRGRNIIISSICPTVFGLSLIKLSIALTIVGGCSHVDESGMRTRGEPHMLLIGDPGTGKSQLLRFAAELSLRSILTTGIGTTTAGLTCAAVRDSGEWMLEAGALVLADRGLCCIDEFNGIRNHDRASIHEAMEQQTLSVAKAGLVCKLNTRTSIFAVTNPKRKYDQCAGIAANTSIASPLLSRFDLIFVIEDLKNQKWDESLSSFILELPSQCSTSPNDDFPGDVEQQVSDTCQQGYEEMKWGIAKLQAYVCFIKERYHPKFNRDAMTILQQYYQRRRSSDDRNAARTTIRMLEGLTRLAQAHARLMCHENVRVVDAVMAVYLMEASKASDSFSEVLSSENSKSSILQVEFACDGDAEYATQENVILKYLDLQCAANVTDDLHHSDSESENGSTSAPKTKRQRFVSDKCSQSQSLNSLVNMQWDLEVDDED